MRAELWEAGVFYGGETVTFGPMSRTAAEALFRQLGRQLDDDATAWIRRVSKREVSR